MAEVIQPGLRLTFQKDERFFWARCGRTPGIY